MTILLRIAERVLNRPLLVHPDKVPLILGVLNGRIPLGDTAALREQAGAHIDDLPPEAQALMRGGLSPGASRFVGSNVDQDPVSGVEKRLPYRRTADGVAIVTVTGSLINRGAWVGSNSGETSYEGIKYQLAAAAADPRASAILLDIESPGGEAVGAFEVAAAVRAANAQKPITAVVNGMAASAAYALASGASRIVTTPTGVVGSIGVVMLHADFSRALDKAGVTPTLIFAGAHKVDGNPFEPLPEGVRTDMQREVDQFYDQFVQTVASGRKGMSPALIRATEARCFIGHDAVDAGLADDVGTFESVLAEMSLRASAQSRAPSKGTTMTTKSEGAPGAVTAGETVQVQKPDPAAAEAARAAILAEGSKAGVTAERERQKAILGSTEAKGRKKLAHHLAFETEMSAEAAIAVMATASKKDEDAPASRLDTLMPGRAAAVDGRPDASGAPGDGLTGAVDRQVGARFGKDAVAN